MRFKGPGGVHDAFIVGGMKFICTFLRKDLPFAIQKYFDIQAVLYVMFDYLRLLLQVE